MSDYNISKICSVCNKVFVSYKCQNRTYCSRACKHIGHGLVLRNGEEKECLTCHKMFYVSYQHSKQRFCSPECYQERPGKYKICPICGKQMLAARKTCSISCMAKSYETLLTGDNNPHWKGGLFTRENSGIPVALREKVLARDNNHCQECGAKDWKHKPSLLHVHHIIPFREDGSAELENFILLCFICHWEGKHGYSLNENMREIASRAHCGDKSYWSRR